MAEEYIEQYFHTPLNEQLESSVYVNWAGHRKCTADHTIGPRVLDTYKFVFVISGKGYLQQGSDPRHSLSGGDLFVLFPKERHYYFADKDDPWELMWVSFNGSQCDSILKSIGISKKNYVIVNAITSSIQRTLQTLLEALGDIEDIQRLRAIGYLLILFVQVGRIARNNSELSQQFEKENIVQKSVAFIEQNYYNHIDVDLLCKHVNYSRSYLSRMFKNDLNSTIPEYINMVRIRNAKALLKETNLSIREIAFSVGINDCFYFSKTFKRLVGQSPVSYRKSEVQ